MSSSAQVKRTELRRTAVMLLRIVGLIPLCTPLSACFLFVYRALFLDAPSLPLGDMLKMCALFAVPAIAVFSVGRLLVDWWLRDPIGGMHARATIAVGAMGVYWHCLPGLKLALAVMVWWPFRDQPSASVTDYFTAWDLIGFIVGTAFILLARPIAAWVLAPTRRRRREFTSG